MVNRRNGLHDVVLALRHIDEAAAVMEVLVVPRPRHRIHAVNRRLEVGVRDLREFRDALQVTAGLHRAGLREDGVFVRVSLDGLRNIPDLVVPENPAVGAWLREDRVRDHVAAPEFFNETLSLLVDQNGAVKPGVGDQLNRARDRVADRVGLDVLHVDEFRPGAFRHVERFARRGRGVRGLKAFIERRVVLLHHRGIVTEAARREHHAALRVELVILPIHRRLHADHAA